MRVRPLVLNDDSRPEIERVKAFAEKHRVDRRALELMLEGKITVIGDNPNYACVVPVGYRCVFSIEDQPDGWMRHLSVAVLGEGQAPNEHAVNMLMQEFGFTCAFQPDQFRTLNPSFTGGWPDGFYTEKLAPDKLAINVLQKI